MKYSIKLITKKESAVFASFVYSYAFSEHSADELMTIYDNPVNKWKAISASKLDLCIILSVMVLVIF